MATYYLIISSLIFDMAKNIA